MFKALVSSAVITATASLSVNASEVHSDVEAYILGGDFIFEDVSLAVNGLGFLSDLGAPLYEAEFGEGLNPANGIDEPGFVIFDESFAPGEWLGFQVVDLLSYWDGGSWSNSTTASLYIEDILGNTTTVTGSSITNPYGLVDQEDGEGGVHTHLDFEIDLGAASGAYLLELAFIGVSPDKLSITTATSDSFYIAFNYGLDEDVFEAGVDALGVSEVPIPAAWLFLASGIGTLVLGRRAKA